MKHIMLFLLLCLPFAMSANAAIDEIKYCEKAEDCAAAQCCHPTHFVNKKYAPSCEGARCTKDCRGPYSCGGYMLVCVDNQCDALPRYARPVKSLPPDTAPTTQE